MSMCSSYHVTVSYASQNLIYKYDRVANYSKVEAVLCSRTLVECCWWEFRDLRFSRDFKLVRKQQSVESEFPYYVPVQHHTGPSPYRSNTVLVHHHTCPTQFRSNTMLVQYQTSFLSIIVHVYPVCIYAL